MRPPTHGRELTTDERTALQAGLRSSNGFVLRRCQVLLANARGERAAVIARTVGCSGQAVHTILRAFDAQGLTCLAWRSSRPRTLHVAFAPERTEPLRALLHQSLRDFGKPTSVWTLELAAQVSFEHGLTATRVTDETIRGTLARFGVKWQRAKHWITSPDPEYPRKKGLATG